MSMGPITQPTSQNAKLGYFLTQTGAPTIYQEVHMYPARGKKNLNGWDDYVNLEEGVDVNRTPLSQTWEAFEINNLHETETHNELHSAKFSHLGTNIIYYNGVTSDMKTYLGAGF